MCWQSSDNQSLSRQSDATVAIARCAFLAKLADNEILTASASVGDDELPILRYPAVLDPLTNSRLAGQFPMSATGQPMVDTRRFRISPSVA
jgi:hypothetical protein